MNLTWDWIQSFVTISYTHSNNTIYLCQFHFTWSCIHAMWSFIFIFICGLMIYQKHGWTCWNYNTWVRQNFHANHLLLGTRMPYTLNLSFHFNEQPEQKDNEELTPAYEPGAINMDHVDYVSSAFQGKKSYPWLVILMSGYFSAW